MRTLYFFIFLSLFAISVQAQFILFDFDNATVSGNTMTQDIFIGSDGYRLTAVHGSTSNAALFDNGGGDLFLRATGGARPEQNWTLSLIKNGSSENFDFISVEYLNSSSATHTFIIGDSSNNPISSQTNIPPAASGTLAVAPANAANATNLNSCLIFGFSFFATMDTYFNNLRIRPVSLLSSEDQKLEKVNYYQDRWRNLKLSHSKLQGAQIEIMNMNGQLLRTLTSDSAAYDVDVTNLVQGIYIARVTMNEYVQTIKFVK